MAKPGQGNHVALRTNLFAEGPSWRTTALAFATLLAALVLCYGNSLSAPFAFDDVPAVVENPTIRDLGAVRTVLGAATPTGTGARGRPLVNLSLAVNHAVGGLDVRGYHVFNLAIHLFAGLALFGIVGRTLRSPLLKDSLDAVAFPCALTAAVLWLVHPLQTETVISAVQRTESLMSLFYLLTLYCFIRSAGSGESAVSGARRVLWPCATVICCLAGMASKEVMVSAPLVLLLYDRTFAAGSFREAWRRRWRLHLALAATWILLAGLMLGSAKRGGTVGLGLGVSSWEYALMQCRALGLYLKLALWPHPLVLDYGTALIRGLAQVFPQALLIVGLLGGTAYALVRSPRVGFLGACFFAILAPSSSFIPLTSQTIAEHRMYLALAPLAVFASLALWRWIRAGAAVALCAVLAAALGWTTARRNEDYRSAIALWADTAAKAPYNERAHDNLGNALADAGRFAEAIPHYEEALRLWPDAPKTHYNLGNALLKAGRVADAIREYEVALRIRPGDAATHYNLGNALLIIGRFEAAAGHFREAIEAQPGYAEAHAALGNALIRSGRSAEAIAHFEAALRLRPGDVDAVGNLGLALAQTGRVPEALARYDEALRLKPDAAGVHNNLASLLLETGRLEEAISHLRAAVQAAPDLADAHYNLGLALLQTGRTGDGIGELQKTLALGAGDAALHFHLGAALLKTGRPREAIPRFEEALRLDPNLDGARRGLAIAREAALEN